MRKQILLQILALFASSLLYATSADLSWNANTEADMASYKIYQNGVVIGTTAHPVVVFSAPGLVEGQTYSFQLSAVDTSNNESALSASVTVTVPNVTPPGKVTGLKVILKN